MSTSAHQTVLKAVLEDTKERTAPNTKLDDFFELFTAEQILKNYGLSYEELASGIVGHASDTRGGDGGMDSVFTFVNGVLVTEDSPFENLKQSVSIHLVIIQSKTSPGFSEEAILKLEATSKDLLDISREPAHFKQQYNTSLIRAAVNFHRIYNKLSAQLPELRISYYYASMADQLHPNVKFKADRLKETISHLFTGASCDVFFLGAAELLTMSRKSRTETLSLQAAEVMSIQSQSTICLVRLKDYYSFIVDKIDSGTAQLKSWLFEENVRDYEGRNVDVNRDIRSTLEKPNSGEDFWWLNNGITIVAAQAPMAGKILTLKAPKIVNGLQTSTEIYNHFRQNHNVDEKRNILVRVIVTNDEQTQNNIIKATNSQSAIRAASLRAFDQVQYTIEQYFLMKDLYYDRRKNYYKNLGKSKDQIVSITYLAQAITAIVLQRPNDSRGRPANLIKNDSLYEQVFSLKYPVELYYENARFMREIDAFLLTDTAPKYILGHEINVKFHLAMLASSMKAKHLKVTPNHIQTHGLGKLDKDFLTICLAHIWRIMKGLKKGRRFDEDQIAKSPEFDQAVRDRLREILITKSRAFTQVEK